MNKADLVNLIAARTELKKQDIHQMINAFVDIVIELVSSGRGIKLLGFGRFDRVKIKARMGRNPRTQEPLQLPERNGVRFLAGKAFKNALKQ